MKTKATKQPKQSNRAAQLKDIKPKKEVKGGTDGNTVYVSGASGGVWKTKDGGRANLAGTP